MSKHTIPELHKTLSQLNTIFKESSSTFCEMINRHEGQFTQKDYVQFKETIQNIKEYASKTINQFFKSKINEKCSIYDSRIVQFSDISTKTCDSLKRFREELQEQTMQLKLAQNKKQAILQHFSFRFNKNAILKKCLFIFKQNALVCRQSRMKDKKMKDLYLFNLKKKVFFPWRRLTYKEGYENQVRKQTEQDLQQIHNQYQSIIQILKDKIQDTDDMIKIKKAAKGEFAYALSKNLLKTISNLSMQVMSLNQMSLQDGQVSSNDTKQFMKKVDEVIKQKLKIIKDYRSNLGIDSHNTEEEGMITTKKKKKITFM